MVVILVPVSYSCFWFVKICAGALVARCSLGLGKLKFRHHHSGAHAQNVPRNHHFARSCWPTPRGFLRSLASNNLIASNEVKPSLRNFSTASDEIYLPNTAPLRIRCQFQENSPRLVFEHCLISFSLVAWFLTIQVRTLNVISERTGKTA